GHGYGNGWIADAQAQCDPAEERDRPLHVRHRHVSDRQAYGSCWLITAGRERPSYARLNERPVRCSVVQKPHRSKGNCPRETQLELERRPCQSCSEVRQKLMRSMSSRY